MPAYRLKNTGQWRKLAEVYRLKNTGQWRKLNRIYRLRSDGTWRRIFSSLGLEAPTIEQTVTITRSAEYHNSSNQVTLTGRKYHFANATTFEYRFFSSPDGNNYTGMGADWISTTNPSSGSSSTVTRTLSNSDFTTSTMYFQFRYRATNSSNVTTTSISTPITVTLLDVPAPPSGFPDINQSTISVASNASSGTWTGSPTLYDWKWQYGGSNATLTYQATPSISSTSLSGTTATATVFNHGFKSIDSVTFSGINDLFNQSATAIFSVFTNFFSYTVSKPAHSFTTNYSINQYVTYGGTIYKSILATPTPRAAWSNSTSYIIGQYVNYNAQLYQASGPSTNISPDNPDFWNLINIYPTSTTYWQSQNGSSASGGTATGTNYHEGTSSSPISYTINSFPSTDYKTGTSLQGLTTRMNVTVYNAAFNSTSNSASRTIYGYPSIFLGAQTITSTTASIIYSEANMDVYDISVRRTVNIIGATVTGGGSTITYTTSGNHSFSSSALVSVSGMTPSTFNSSDIVVISTTSNTFTISNLTGATGSSTGNGTALGTISGYPLTNQANSSPISITGLSSGSTYTVYVTPKNADSPRVSGIQKTTSFTTPQIPVNTVAPTISPLNNRGRAPVSTQLVSTQGTWTGVDGSTTYTYQWQYFENATIGWVNFSETGNNTNTFTIPSFYNGFNVRCRVRATNGSQFADAATEYIADAAVSVGSISPTSVTQNQSTNFSFSVSGYPTSYTINWGDGSSNETYNVSSGTSSVNATHAHTYTTVTTRTITVTAQPGSKTNSANITISAPSPSASGFDRFNTSTNPSQPSVITFSSSNNQVISTWTNGSPITSVFYSYSGAGTNGSLTDNTAPFVTSDTTSYSQSGTFTMNVFNYNDNMQVTFSWNQSNARSYRVIYNHSVLGNGFTLNGNNTGSSASAIANFTTAGTITWSSLTVYSGDNQTGTSVTYSNPTFSISVPRPESSRTGSVSLTYVLPKLATPTGVTASSNRTDGVLISWNAVSGAAYYGVWYEPPIPSYDSLADFGGNRNTTLITGTSYLETSLGSGVTRVYWVQAYRSGDPVGTKSEWGGPATGTKVAASSTGAVSIAYVAPTTNAVNVTTGSGAIPDDGFFTLNLPFNTFFNGTSYSQIHIGTNSYATFGGGSGAFSGLSASNPAFNKIMVDAADRGSTGIYYTSSASSWTMRYQGSSGTSGSPIAIIWELQCFSSNPKSIRLSIAQVAGGGTTGMFSSSSLINSLGGAGTSWNITSA
jgi:hypothetical protein